jgi:hypothetical protein
MMSAKSSTFQNNCPISHVHENAMECQEDIAGQVSVASYLQENVANMMNTIENGHPALAGCLLEQVQWYACRSVNRITQQHISTRANRQTNN